MTTVEPAVPKCPSRHRRADLSRDQIFGDQDSFAGRRPVGLHDVRTPA